METGISNLETGPADRIIIQQKIDPETQQRHIEIEQKSGQIEPERKSEHAHLERKPSLVERAYESAKHLAERLKESAAKLVEHKATGADVEEVSKDKPVTEKEASGEAVEKKREKGGIVADRVESIELIGQRAETSAAEAQKQTTEALSKPTEIVHKGAEKTEESFGKVRERAKEMLEKTKEKVSEGAEKVKAKIGHGMEYGQEKFGEGAEKLESKTELKSEGFKEEKTKKPQLVKAKSENLEEQKRKSVEEPMLEKVGIPTELKKVSKEEEMKGYAQAEADISKEKSTETSKQEKVEPQEKKAEGEARFEEPRKKGIDEIFAEMVESLAGDFEIPIWEQGRRVSFQEPSYEEAFMREPGMMPLFPLIRPIIPEPEIQNVVEYSIEITERTLSPEETQLFKEALERESSETLEERPRRKYSYTEESLFEPVERIFEGEPVKKEPLIRTYQPIRRQPKVDSKEKKQVVLPEQLPKHKVELLPEEIQERPRHQYEYKEEELLEPCENIVEGASVEHVPLIKTYEPITRDEKTEEEARMKSIIPLPEREFEKEEEKTTIKEKAEHLYERGKEKVSDVLEKVKEKFEDVFSEKREDRGMDSECDELVGRALKMSEEMATSFGMGKPHSTNEINKLRKQAEQLLHDLDDKMKDRAKMGFYKTSKLLEETRDTTEHSVHFLHDIENILEQRKPEILNIELEKVKDIKDVGHEVSSAAIGDISKQAEKSRQQESHHEKKPYTRLFTGPNIASVEKHV